MLCEEHTFGAKEFILVGVVGPFTLFCIFLEGRRGKPSVRKLSVSQVANIKIGLQFHTKLDNIERKPSVPMYFSYDDASIYSYSFSSSCSFSSHDSVKCK